MNFPNGTRETCHNCNECGVTKTRNEVDKAVHTDRLSVKADVRHQWTEVRIELMLKELQGQMAQTDLMTEPRPPRPKSNSGFIELLLAKRKNMKIKIYEEKGHSMPHVHIDYGRENHVASFSIESAERIEGTLSPKYDRDIKAWISKNKEKLLEVWSDMQSGSDPKSLITELRGDA